MAKILVSERVTGRGSESRAPVPITPRTTMEASCRVTQIALLTPVHPRKAAFLDDAAASVFSLTDVNWRWYVQVDGAEAGSLSMAGHPGVQIAYNGQHLGTAATRNRALACVDSPYVATLDADDLLEPSGLAPLVEALERDPAAGFAIGGAIDFFPDGHSELAQKSCPYPVGRIARGAIEDRWLSAGSEGVFIGAVCWRTDVLLQLGGWSALAGMEDTDLLLDASHHFPAQRVDVVVHRYRVHPDQTTLSASYATDRSLNRRWIWRRANARRAAADRPTLPMPPDPSGSPERDRARRVRAEPA